MQGREEPVDEEDDEDDDETDEFETSVEVAEDDGAGWESEWMAASKFFLFEFADVKSIYFISLYSIFLTGEGISQKAFFCKQERCNMSACFT